MVVVSGLCQPSLSCSDLPRQDLNCQEEEDPMNKLKGQKIVSCRICKGDHWTTRCPYKDTLGPMQKELAEQLGLSTGEKEKLPGGARARGCGWQAVGWRTGIVCASGRVVGRQLASEQDRHCWWLSPPTQQCPHCTAVTTGHVRLCERDWQVGALTAGDVTCLSSRGAVRAARGHGHVCDYIHREWWGDGCSPDVSVSSLP